MKNLLRFAAAAVLVSGAGAASAHHSGAMFDHSRVVVLTGTVKKFSYQAPHSRISIIGGPETGGEAKQWDAETVSPGTLVTMGVTRETLKPGDKVTLGIYPLRDGRAAGAMIYVVTADGKTYGTKPDHKPQG